MKILKIRAEGISLFKGTCEMDFTALQRVNADNAEKMHPIFTTGGQTYYQNSVTSFIGINASGKTTILRLISFVFRLLNNESINTFDNHGFFDKLTNKDVVTAAGLGVDPHRCQSPADRIGKASDRQLFGVADIADEGIIQIAEIVIDCTTAGHAAHDSDPVL